MSSVQEPRLKRYCGGEAIRDFDMGVAPLEQDQKKTSEVVFGAQLLNACRSGDRYESLSVLSNITSFASLKMKDVNNRTSLSYARSRKMDDVADQIQNRIIVHLMEACHSQDVVEAEAAFQEIDDLDIILDSDMYRAVVDTLGLDESFNDGCGIQ